MQTWTHRTCLDDAYPQVADMKGKRVATSSLTGLTNSRLQWLEMLKYGVDLMSDTAQVMMDNSFQPSLYAL